MNGFRSPALLLLAMLIVALGSCGDGGGGDRGSQTGPTGGSPAQRPPAKRAPARPLPARWYEDADGNGVPNFIEVERGYDPATDDCLARAGCDQALVAQAFELLEKPNNTMLLLDSSGSMAASAGGGQKKITVAKQALARYVGALPSAFRLGFEVFGHRGSSRDSGKAASCRGVEILARPGELRKESVAGVLDRFEPRGFTPLGAALRRAADAFEGQEDATNRVILVTDGVETCGGDPVAAARALRESGVAVTVDVVGFDVRSADAAKLRGIAEASGGVYTDARSAEALKEYFAAERRRLDEINKALKCVVRNRERQMTCAVAQRDATLKAIYAARDEAGRAGRTAEADALTVIAERALELQQKVIDERFRANQAKIDQFLREYKPAAYEGDDACAPLGRAFFPSLPTRARRGFAAAPATAWRAPPVYRGSRRRASRTA